MSDELLLEMIAGGDREAFAELYRRYRSDICRFAAHMCGSQTAAEDILHEVFIAVIESASRYRPGERRVKLWLFGIRKPIQMNFPPGEIVMIEPSATG